MATDPQRFINTVRFIRYGVMHLGRRMRLERGDDALSPSKLILLGWLSRNGALTPTGLAARERVRPQSLTRTLASLEEDGLITRQAGTRDRRQSLVAITDKGRQAVNRDMEQRDRWLATVMTERLSPTECEMLRLATHLMERLAADSPPEEEM
jgi:DNA-binding MarR family transcriptional regulator